MTLGLRDADGDHGSLSEARVDDEAESRSVDLPQAQVDVPQPDVDSLEFAGENGAQTARVPPHSFVLDGHDRHGPLVPRGDHGRALAFSRFDAVPDGVLDEGLQAQVGDPRGERLRTDLQPHLEPVTETGPFQQEVAVDRPQFIRQHGEWSELSEGVPVKWANSTSRDRARWGSVIMNEEMTLNNQYSIATVCDHPMPHKGEVLWVSFGNRASDHPSRASLSPQDPDGFLPHSRG